jgi:hypothetical protein
MALKIRFFRYLCSVCKNVAPMAKENKYPHHELLYGMRFYEIAYDDVGALTMLHALADSGEAEILATFPQPSLQRDICTGIPYFSIRFAMRRRVSSGAL